MAYGLGIGLILSALAAAVVGSLVAAGVSRLTDIKVELPVEEIEIDLPGSVLELEEDSEEVLEEKTMNYKRKSASKYPKQKLGGKNRRKKEGKQF